MAGRLRCLWDHNFYGDAAYTTWTELGGVKPEWDLLSEDDKRRWGKAVRSSYRVMLSLMAELQLDEDDGKVTARKSA
jgi:hypothetical protein